MLPLVRVPLLLLPLVLAGAALGASLAASRATADTSHAGWPEVDVLKMNKRDQSRPLRGHRGKNNELLGGHGDDHITGRNRGDVIWGDYKPSGQPSSQRDVLRGGGGRDFIYASHGYNLIDTGRGADVVHAHFGRGRIRCHSRRTVVFLSHRGRPGWRLRGCHRISYRTLGY